MKETRDKKQEARQTFPLRLSAFAGEKRGKYQVVSIKYQVVSIK